MNKQITCLLLATETPDLEQTIGTFKNSEIVSKIIIVTPKKMKFEGVEQLVAKTGLEATKTWKLLSEKIDTDYVVIYTKKMALKLGQNALLRMMKVCHDTNAGMVYSDYFEKKEGQLKPHPVIEFQDGSLRDDFNFGSVLLYSTKALTEAVRAMNSDYQFAAMYDLRLRVSQKKQIVHLPELLYTEIELDTRKSGEKMFDYVDPRNRERQIEMEQACTEHLKAIRGYLKPIFKKIEFSEKNFPVEASVIIPVRNRVKTIGDAIDSVLKQITSFDFNVIIIDNHSSDGTTTLIKNYADDKRVVHVIPDRDDLGIGGCWNEGVAHEKCGKFAIQLDSDDLYIDDTVVERIVKAFYEQNCEW